MDDMLENSKKTTLVERSGNSVVEHYNNISVTKTRDVNSSTTTVKGVEEMLKKIVPAKSFLYRNQSSKTERINSSYVSMTAVPSKKAKSKYFRLSSYEYPLFDLSKFKYFSTATKNENFNDHGYYSIQKFNNKNFNQRQYKIAMQRSRTRSFSSADDFIYSTPDIALVEDHFYEDLCYNDTNKIRLRSVSTGRDFGVMSKSACVVKIQEIFNSMKLPSIFRGPHHEKKQTETEGMTLEQIENSDMYDSVVVANAPTDSKRGGGFVMPKSTVEDYLEPVHPSKDYCDVLYREKKDSIVGAILRLFENNFGFRKEAVDIERSEKFSSECQKPAQFELHVRNPDTACTAAIVQGTGNGSCENQKWRDSHRKSKMADRPLPVPVEVEPYYKNVDRPEAEQLLAGCEDGTFILRPSSQACHAYTLSVCCAGAVHNVGVRRRSDGRLALGFSRRGERSHADATALLEYHRRRHLLLRPAGKDPPLGRVVLKGPPDHYKVPAHPAKPVRDSTAT